MKEEKTKAILRGTGASSGRVTGIVKLVPSSSMVDKIKEGEILVTTNTTPAFTPAMLRAGAVVTDTGGMLSHASITCRELGIPCVVGTGQATEILTDEKEIIVDGNRGIIYER